MYDELVKRMWECASGECFNCSQYTETTNASICQKELMKQAADAIEQLTADLERSREWEAFWKEQAEEAKGKLQQYALAAANKTRWIPVTERLPEDDTICILTNGVAEAIGYRGKVFGWHLIWTDYLVEGEVTHWMPLPEPPKEE